MPKTIKMLRDTPVSPNGFDNETWLKGEVKENVSDALAADLTHPETLAAVEVTGDAKADAKAEAEAAEAAARLKAEQDAAIAAAKAEAEAAAKSKTAK